MSKYNEQHATTMLNALQGTETLERFKQEIRTDFITEIYKSISTLIPLFSNEQLKAYFEICDKIEQLKQQNQN